MKTSLYNLEDIKSLISEQGFHYIDGFLPDNEFQICSGLALKAWKNKSDWFLRINNGEKSYKIHYNDEIITDKLYKKFSSSIVTSSEKLTFWYYAIHQSDLTSSANNGKDSLLIVQRALLADKHQYIFRSLIDNWRAESYFLTCFDKYSFISKHTDVGGNSDGKYKLTLILYLTPDITESDGGHLAFHSPAGEVKIWPKANRLVLFLPSPKTVHEVRPVTHSRNISRLAISGWLI